VFDGQEIDSRPSDAIALAVRVGVPIFVAEKVMEDAAFLPENEAAEKQIAPPAQSKDPKVNALEALRAQLKEAIEKEDYERAAKLRDEVRRLEMRD
jgi:bifunctional DNase/RNase